MVQRSRCARRAATGEVDGFGQGRTDVADSIVLDRSRIRLPTATPGYNAPMTKTQPNPQPPAVAHELSSTGTKRNHLDALIRLQREAESRAYREEFLDRRRRIVMDYSRIHRRSKEVEAESAPTMLSADELGAWKEWNSWVAVPGPALGIAADSMGAAAGACHPQWTWQAATRAG